MKILIITQYFPPEVGAPQNRLFELGIQLQKKDVMVEVLTAMPNYPKGEVFSDYKNTVFKIETIGGIKTYRCAIYATKSRGVIKRLLNYFSFVVTSLWFGIFKIEKKYDIVICESPPLFLGISAWLLSKSKKAKFIFNVSDLWPESAEKLGIITNKFFLKTATKLEEFLYKKANMISGQTQGIVKDIYTRFPNKKVYWLPNGVDIDLFSPQNIVSEFRKNFGFSDTDMLFCYAGILGHAQGLEVIINAAEILKQKKNIKFLLVGAGPEKQQLVELKSKLNIDNVYFIDILPKKEIPSLIAAIDAAIIPLKKLELFKGAIPSKIFENLAMQKPIILGVEGEAKELFIDEGRAGVFFEPENAADLAHQIEMLSENSALLKELGVNGRMYVEKRFNRAMIAQEFYETLMQLI